MILKLTSPSGNLVISAFPNSAPNYDAILFANCGLELPDKII